MLIWTATTLRKPIPKEPKSFVSNVKIEDIIELYESDRKLKLIILEEIQKVEVALRRCLSEYMSNKYANAHWFMDMRENSSILKWLNIW